MTTIFHVDDRKPPHFLAISDLVKGFGTSKISILIALRAAIGVSICELAGPIVVRHYMDMAALSHNVKPLVIMSLLYLVLSMAAGALALVSAYWAGFIGWSAADQLRDRLFAPLPL